MDDTYQFKSYSLNDLEIPKNWENLWNILKSMPEYTKLDNMLIKEQETYTTFRLFDLSSKR